MESNVTCRYCQTKFHFDQPILFCIQCSIPCHVGCQSKVSESTYWQAKNYNLNVAYYCDNCTSNQNNQPLQAEQFDQQQNQQTNYIVLLNSEQSSFAIDSLQQSEIIEETIVAHIEDDCVQKITTATLPQKINNNQDFINGQTSFQDLDKFNKSKIEIHNLTERDVCLNESFINSNEVTPTISLESNKPLLPERISQNTNLCEKNDNNTLLKDTNSSIQVSFSDQQIPSTNFINKSQNNSESCNIKKESSKQALKNEIIEDHTKNVSKKKENKFEIIRGGSQNKNDQLISTEGFVYCKTKHSKPGTIRWLCSQKTTHRCSGCVVEKNGEFTKINEHTHLPDPKNIKKLEEYRKVSN